MLLLLAIMALVLAVVGVASPVPMPYYRAKRFFQSRRRRPAARRSSICVNTGLFTTCWCWNLHAFPPAALTLFRMHFADDWHCFYCGCCSCCKLDTGVLLLVWRWTIPGCGQWQPESSSTHWHCVGGRDSGGWSFGHTSHLHVLPYIQQLQQQQRQ